MKDMRETMRRESEAAEAQLEEATFAQAQSVGRSKLTRRNCEMHCWRNSEKSRRARRRPRNSTNPSVDS